MFCCSCYFTGKFIRSRIVYDTSWTFAYLQVTLLFLCLAMLRCMIGGSIIWNVCGSPRSPHEECWSYGAVSWLAAASLDHTFVQGLTVLIFSSPQFAHYFVFHCAREMKPDAVSLTTESKKVLLVFQCQRPPLWSSSQDFLATDPEVPGSIPSATRISE
jgi:hypothetical protein